MYYKNVETRLQRVVNYLAHEREESRRLLRNVLHATSNKLFEKVSYGETRRSANGLNDAEQTERTVHPVLLSEERINGNACVESTLQILLSPRCSVVAIPSKHENSVQRVRLVSSLIVTNEGTPVERIIAPD